MPLGFFEIYSFGVIQLAINNLVIWFSTKLVIIANKIHVNQRYIYIFKFIHISEYDLIGNE